MSDSHWISIKDKLPVLHVPVFVVLQRKIPEASVAYIDECGWTNCLVSHWMPIPALIIDPEVYEVSLKTLSEPELPL